MEPLTRKRVTALLAAAVSLSLGTAALGQSGGGGMGGGFSGGWDAQAGEYPHRAFQRRRMGVPPPPPSGAPDRDRSGDRQEARDRQDQSRTPQATDRRPSRPEHSAGQSRAHTGSAYRGQRGQYPAYRPPQGPGARYGRAPERTGQGSYRGGGAWSAPAGPPTRSQQPVRQGRRHQDPSGGWSVSPSIQSRPASGAPAPRGRQAAPRRQ